jgi:formate dehydrogenase major subunit
MRHAMPSIAGISDQRLQQQGSVTYPCHSPDEPSEAVLFRDRFPTADGRARLTPASLQHPDERPDHDYPWILITGRQLEHWHTGAMSRRSRVLDALQPHAVAFLHPDELQRLAIRPGDPLTIQSRRGQVRLHSRADPGLLPKQIFLPFCYAEAAANLLTNPALDPDAHIPEFKYCAVRVTAAQ